MEGTAFRHWNCCALALAAFATVIAAVPVARANVDDAFSKRWGPWVEMGGRFSDSRSIGEANLFAPVWQNSDSLLFFDVRASFDNHHAREGNFGLGFRHMLDNGWNLGGYGYLDVRRSSAGNSFYQTTLGVEALGETFDFRANAYLPIGKREKWQATSTSTSTISTAPEAVLTGTSLAIQRQVIDTVTTNYLIERAMAGFDAEIGARLPVFSGDDFKLDVKAFAGGYHFEAEGMRDISGPRARLELVARDFAAFPGMKLTGGLTWQDDKVRGEQLIGSVGLRIPFHAPARGAKPLSYMEERMMDAVVRDVDIVTNSRSATTVESVVSVDTEAAINTWNDKVVASLTHVDANDLDGDAIQAHLNDRQAAAGADGSVVVLNGHLTYDTSGLVVNDNQTLLGGGTTLRVRGAATGVEVDYVTAGAAGSVAAFGVQPTVTTFHGAINLGSHSVVGGLTITQTRISVTNAAVYAYDTTGSIAFGNVIQGSDAVDSHGIVFHGSIDGIAKGNVITTAGRPGTYGLVAFQNATNILFEGNDVTTNTALSATVLVHSDSSARVVGNILRPWHTGSVIVGSSNATFLPDSVGNTIVDFDTFIGIRCDGVLTASGTVEFTNAPACNY